MELKCKHCGTVFRVRDDIKTNPNCRKCGYKVFVSTSRTCTPEMFVNNKAIQEQTVKLNTDDEIRIVPFGDWHVGAPKNQCEIEKLIDMRDWILKTKDTYMIGLGDYMDCAQKMPWKNGPSVYDESEAPTDQFFKVEKILKPLADAGKILGLHQGNHEEWISQNVGFDVIRVLCDNLKVPFLDPACETTVILNEKFKYKIYSFHGTGCPRTETGALNTLDRNTKRYFADIFLMGHTHQKAVKEGARIVNGKLSKTYNVLTGHWLSWKGSYAQRFAFDPIPVGVCLIKLYSKRFDFHVSV